MTTARLTAMIGLGALIVVLALWGMPPKSEGTGNTLLITSESAPDALDPGISYQVVSWMTMVNVYNGLLTYKKASGAEGAMLVPDLAEAMPEVLEGGTVYRFRMRAGVQWGPPLKRDVLPSDIKYAIERDIKLPSPGSSFFANIEGVTELSEKKAKEISGIIVDDAARTIEFHLLRADATFLNVLALPFSFAVPKGTPIADQSLAGFIPATGPYMLTHYNPQSKIVLKRNPNYKQWTEHVPPGYVDAMEIKLGVNPENAVTLIKRGKADFMFGSVPRSKLPLLLKDPVLKKQMHIDKAPTTSYIYMNTTIAPFDKLEARQAINWAIDRRAMVKITGGLGEPTETILPPNIPGYRNHKLYPGPDLDKARALLDEAGVKRGPIDIWCRTNAPTPDLAVYLQGVMSELGWKPTVKCIDAAAYFTLVGNPATKAQIGFGNWSQDFPEGSNFIDVLLNGAYITKDRSNNLAYYSGADEQIAAANKLLDPEARNKAWGDLDLQIMKDAAWAPFLHGTTYTFTSKRLDNYTPNPVYDMLFMQVKLKGQKSKPMSAAEAKALEREAASAARHGKHQHHATGRDEFAAWRVPRSAGGLRITPNRDEVAQ